MSDSADAREADRNLALWKWADHPPHQVLAVDDHARLPKGDRSWH